MKRFLFVMLLLTQSLVTQALDWTSNYDIEWKSPSEKVGNSMPLGAGDIGCNVWVENGSLLFYIQRSGSFNEIGEYIKMGRVRMTLNPNPFSSGSSFSQKLILKDGYIAINGTGNGASAKINLWVDQYTHSVNCTVDADREVECRVAYETWRTATKNYLENPTNYEKGKINTSRFGSFALVFAPMEVTTIKDEYGFEGNKVVFYHKNPEETLSPNVGIKQQGLEKYRDSLPNIIKNRTTGGMVWGDNFVASGITRGKYVKTNFEALNLKSKKAAKNHSFHIATHIEQQSDIKIWRKALDKRFDEIGKSGGNFEKNIKWWNNFWKRSWIVISPDKKDEKSAVWQIGRNYNLMRYILGGNGYGDFPTKFNGGSLTMDEWNDFGPDWRKWGGDFFTAQNQRLIYWPMLKSGDFDMMAPQFNLYKRALKGSEIRTKEHFGHKGAMFSENVDVTGIHLPLTYGWQDKNCKYGRGKDLPYGDKSVPGFVRANSPIERGIMISPSVAYHFQGGVEHAYMMLMYHKYTGKSIEEYMPMIKASLVFYNEHYRARQKMRNGKELDDNGKLLFMPSQGAECYKPATNPVDVITALKSCLEELVDFDAPYVTKKDKDYYREMLSVMPPLTYGTIKGKKVIKPALKFGGGGNMEKPQFYPLFPYQNISLLDREIEIFRNTWNLDSIVNKSPTGGGWAQDGIFLAHMGMAKEALELHKIKMGDSTKRRFPAFWGPFYDGTPDINHGGSGMIGVQDMLLQSVGHKILILPAWPKDIDVNFKLHATYNTTVEVEYKDGKIEKLVVTPKKRAKDIITKFKY